MKRRKFIDQAGRWFLLGGLLGTSGFLLWRKQLGNPDNCFKNPFCQSCNQFRACAIVADLKVKNHEQTQGK
jgi:hypothetical protein